MRARLPAALTLAFFAFVATTGVSTAAGLSDRDAVLVYTGLTIAGLLAFLTLAYLIRRSLGLDRRPPPDASAGEHH